jgi:hypothetical protein
MTDPSKWLEVQGGGWTPTVSILAKAEAALRAAVPPTSLNRGRIPPWESYTFQDQGRTTLLGKRYVFINAFCADAQPYADVRKTWVNVYDGGACYFSAKYDAASNDLYGIEINGVA